MNTFRLGLVFLHCVVFLQLSGCASLDGSVNPAVTGGKLLRTSAEVHTPDNVTKVDRHLLDSSEDYVSSEYEDNYPRVSTLPKASSLTALKDQGKGKDRKKNLCLEKIFRDYCVNGVCQYLAELNRTSCICEAGYSGERCLLFILPVGKEAEGNSHTTVLAIMAVVLSLMCLTIIGLLLALRCQKKGDSSVDEKIRLQPLHSSEEKVKFIINGHLVHFILETQTNVSVGMMATTWKHPVKAEEGNECPEHPMSPKDDLKEIDLKIVEHV